MKKKFMDMINPKNRRFNKKHDKEKKNQGVMKPVVMLVWSVILALVIVCSSRLYRRLKYRFCARDGSLCINPKTSHRSEACVPLHTWRHPDPKHIISITLWGDIPLYVEGTMRIIEDSKSCLSG